MSDALQRTQFRAGLRSDPTPRDAGEFCADALNFISRDGELIKRQGNAPRRNVFVNPTAGNAGFGNYSLGTYPDPATMGTGITNGADTASIYLMHTSKWQKCRADVVNGASEVRYSGAWFDTITWEYWNGSAWVAVPAIVDCAGPQYNDTDDVMSVGIFGGWDPNDSGINSSFENGLNIAIAPERMTDWATKTINGKTGYVIRGRYASGEINGTGAALDTAYFDAFGDDDHRGRIQRVLTWVGATGEAHEFLAVMGPDASNHDICFFLDGQQLTEVGSVTTTVTHAAQDQDVFAFYHSDTDRVIGHIAGRTWFYVIASSSSDRSVYLLDAFSESNTEESLINPYASLAAGLRGAIPPADVVVQHDDRFFGALGERVFWSGTFVYPDTWPNEFERFITDGYGPVIDMVSGNGSLFLFKRKAIYIAQPSGESDGYDFVPLQTGLGAIGAVISVDKMIMAVCEDGLRQFNGEKFVKVSGPIDNMFKDGLAGALDHALAVYVSAVSQWRVFFPSGSGNVCDRGLYVDMSGQAADEGDEEAFNGIFPVGAYDKDDNGDGVIDDLGPQLTAVCEDSTGTYREVVYGDRYGVLWTMDRGTQEWGRPVRARIIQAPQNVGKGATVLPTRITVSMEPDAARNITVGVVPDGDVGRARTGTVNWSRTPGASAALLSAYDPLDDAMTLKDWKRPVTLQAECATRCRQFSVMIRDESDGQLTIYGIELEGEMLGRRL